MPPGSEPVTASRRSCSKVAQAQNLVGAGRKSWPGKPVGAAEEVELSRTGRSKYSENFCDM